MIMKSYLEEYENLIGKAECQFDIQEGYTLYENINDPLKYFDINRSYNGFNNPDYFKAKLKSYTCFIELDVNYANSGIYRDYNIIERLEKLLNNFVIINSKVTHKKFYVEKAPNVVSLRITEDEFLDFINVAYESLSELLNLKPKALLDLISGDKVPKIKFIEKSLQDLGISNKFGENILSERKKGILWAYISVLKEYDIIISTLNDKDYFKYFWDYLNPKNSKESSVYIPYISTRPHKDTKIYKNHHKKIENYMKINGFVKINDNYRASDNSL